MAQSKRSGAVRVGALLVLAVCFVGSALIRAGEVIAALPGTDDGFGNPIPTADQQISSADEKEEVLGDNAPAEVLAEIRRQRADLESREDKIEARERELRALKTRLEKRLDEIRTARDRLAKTAALVDDAAGKDVARLAAMYQQMKPKQAGQIFNEMAPSFAAGFIAEMRPEAAALVMANMDADKAYAVSLIIAGRNVSSPSQSDVSTPANEQEAAQSDAAGQ